MRSKLLGLAFIFFGIQMLVHAQARWFVVENLQPKWLEYQNGEYVPFEDSRIKTIYFRLVEDKYRGQHLNIRSQQDWSLFINGKLLGTYPSGKIFSIDSLRSEFQTSELSVAIHKKIINKENLQTEIISASSPGTSSPLPIQRQETFFRDFVITAALVLLIMVIAVNQLTKLQLSFIFTKRFFSISDGDEPQLYSRVSGSNILYIIFGSLILAYYFIVIFHFTPDRYELAWAFKAISFLSALWAWIKLSLLVLAAILVKIILVFIMSRLFAFREIFGFQIFNWIKLLMAVFGFANVILLLYFISRGVNESVYISFFWGFVVVLIAWFIILFARVARKSDYSLFHIFSYLCATEIIPLLVTIKLLYH